MEPAEPAFDLAAYYPLFLYLIAILGFAVSTIVAAHLIGPKTKKSVYEDVKLMPYESGMDPIGNARQHFDIKYYLVAIMFLVFDVELLFLYPWAVTAYAEESWLPAEIRTPVFWAIIVFIALLAAAYLYDLMKGVFRWR